MTGPDSQPDPLSGGDGTRERLLRAGLAVFGDAGFEAASTRRLADAAGVNLAAIPYHFGSKHGLYLAVAEHIAARMWARLGPVTTAVAARLEADPDDAELRELLRGLMMPMADVLIGSRESARWAPFVMREQAHPTEAFDILHRQCIARVMRVTAQVVGRLLRQPPLDESNVLTLHTLFGQILVFRASRAAVLRNLQWDDIDAQRLTRIKSHIWYNVCAILDARAERAGES